MRALDTRSIAIDVLVTNAGYGVAAAFDGSDAAAELGMIDVNIRVVELTHIDWPRMLKNNRGGVLNVGSTAGFQPVPFMAVYAPRRPSCCRSPRRCGRKPVARMST